MVWTLHIGLPSELHAPGVAECVKEFVQSEAFSQICGDWKTHFIQYDRATSFNVNDLHAAVTSAPGPVLLLHPVKHADLARLRDKLAGRHIVSAAAVYDADQVQAAIVELKQAHDAGEPLLPLDLVVALLIMRKLDRERMWMGHNKKGCMWAEDIPKGRGVDEKFRPRVEPVINVLFQNEILVTKRSRGLNKYALNPDRREEIMGILQARCFSGRLHDHFNRCRETASCRELDLLDEYNG